MEFVLDVTTMGRDNIECASGDFYMSLSNVLTNLLFSEYDIIKLKYRENCDAYQNLIKICMAVRWKGIRPYPYIDGQP